METAIVEVEAEMCEKCNGTGDSWPLGRNCPCCHGTGAKREASCDDNDRDD